VTDDSAFKKQVRARLLADHIELAGVREAGIAAGSEILMVQDMRIDQIADAIHRRLGRAAGVRTIAVSGDLVHVQVAIQADHPGVVFGHGGAELDRLRTELAELIGKPVQLNMYKDDGPPKGRKEIPMGPVRPPD
jgi:KH domain